MTNSTGRLIRKFTLLLVLFLLLGACGGGATDKNSLTDPDRLAIGKRIYESNCAACHGLRGEGQPHWKVPVNGVYPAPPHDSSGHTWHHPDPQLLDIIAKGGGLPNSAMPAYADILTPDEAVAVLDYIKTFWGRQEREFQAQITRQQGDQ